jgi:hypothetical protein
MTAPGPERLDGPVTLAEYDPSWPAAKAEVLEGILAGA